MSGGAQPSVGQTLREAREAQGITQDNAAVRLRLMHRQIEAMERDDFESLGQPVFARGFVRNYARLLGLAADPLLDRMSGTPAQPAAVRHVEPPPPRTWLSSPWLILSLLGLLLFVVVPVALYLWLNSEPEADSARQAMPAVHPAPAVAAAPAPVPAVAVAAASATAPMPPPAVDPAAAGSDSAAAPAPAVPDPAPAESVLHLEFADESWTEIKDARGRTLLRQLSRAGSSADIQGQPPFDVVIGNASQVQMTYNGRSIDLKPFVDGTVARFSLEE